MRAMSTVHVMVLIGAGCGNTVIAAGGRQSANANSAVVGSAAPASRKRVHTANSGRTSPPSSRRAPAAIRVSKFLKKPRGASVPSLRNGLHSCGAATSGIGRNWCATLLSRAAPKTNNTRAAGPSSLRQSEATTADERPRRSKVELKRNLPEAGPMNASCADRSGGKSLCVRRTASLTPGEAGGGPVSFDQTRNPEVPLRLWGNLKLSFYAVKGEG